MTAAPRQIQTRRLSYRTEVPASQEAITSVRAILPGMLTAAGIPAETADTVQLCTHELMANVARHIGEGAPLRLTMHAQEGWVAVEVHDRDGVRFPEPRPCDWAAESGRGLHILSSAAPGWLALPSDFGKAVRFRLGSWG